MLNSRAWETMYYSSGGYAPPVRLYSSAAQAQMQAEQEAARRRQQESVQLAVAPGMMKAELVVPMDAFPGKNVRIAVAGKEYMVMIPQGARPGQRILIQVPVASAPVTVAQPVQTTHHHAPAQYAAAPPPAAQYPSAAAPPAQTYAPPSSAAHLSHHSSTSYASSAPSLASTGYLSTSSMTSYSVPPPSSSASISNTGYVPDSSYSTPSEYSKPGYVPSSTSGSAPPALNPGRLSHASSSAEQGRLAFSQAMSGSIAPPPDPEVRLRVTTDHLISAELRESYAEHNIISVSEGETVTLIEGDLDAGLPSPYEDYVNVRASDGRVGKVAKVALQAYT